MNMTNYIQDSKDESDGEEFNSLDDAFSDADSNISILEKPLEGIRALMDGIRTEFSKEKLNVSVPISNTSSKPSCSTTLHNWKDIRKGTSDESSCDYSDEELEYGRSCYEDNHFAMDDSDGDDDTQACFPCPFCLVDIEVHVLCNHLQDEHCFDLKNAVCPICAANLGKDVIGHFTVQHASSSKRRKKSQKPGLWAGSSAMLGRELSSFLGSSSNNKANTHESAQDPLLSPFMTSPLHSDPNGSQQDESSNKSTAATSRYKSTETSSVGGNELNYEEIRQKAAFVQQLIASTIF